MENYFYIIVVAIILLSKIFRGIYLYTKGQYNPYPFRKESNSSIIKNFEWLIVSVGGFLFLRDIKLMAIIFLFCSFWLVVSVSILNYLSYIKIKDKKIITQTIVFNIIIIAVSFGIWKYTISLHT
ncbi:hypothetical protein [Desulfotomaculum defluvii]